MREIKAAVMFANAGIGEFYARHANVKVVVAIELETDRADLYKSIYPDCEVINGDVTNPEDMESFLKKCREDNVELLLASPPCQGHSKANQSENKDEDIRNRLILNVTQTIDAYPFKNVLIENVPDFLDYQSDTILPEFEGLTVRAFLEKFFADRNFKVDINQYVNAREYSETPQNRTRAIVLASKISNWSLPPKLPQEKWKTIEDAIGDLPSLESGERGIIKYENDPDWKDRLDILKYHNAPYWKEKDVEVMKHTATGCSAFDNLPPYRPTKKNGEPKEYYRSAYRRPKWSDAFPCVLQGSDGMGGMVTCHPGRELPDGTYSDARAYTILELLRSYALPDDFPFPAWASDEEDLQRDVLGEAFAPLLVKNILLNMPR